jgi:hypothetical protein
MVTVVATFKGASSELDDADDVRDSATHETSSRAWTRASYPGYYLHPFNDAIACFLSSCHERPSYHSLVAFVPLPTHLALRVSDIVKVIVEQIASTDGSGAIGSIHARNRTDNRDRKVMPPDG